MPAYQRYFDNCFAALPVSRAAFHALGTSVLTAVRAAYPTPDFAPLLAELETALRGFALQPVPAAPSPGSEALRTARRHWLAFVDDTMKDYVTPRLRQLPAYDDFRRYSRRQLAQLEHPELLRQSKLLLGLYSHHAPALGYPAVAADGWAVYQQLLHADQARTIAEAVADAERAALPSDWQQLARALRRIKGLLEVHLEPTAVYRIFALPAEGPQPDQPTQSAASTVA